MKLLKNRVHEKDSIMVLLCESKILSLRITVQDHAVSLLVPNSYPRDGIFNPHLTTINAPGPNSGDIDFSLRKAWVYAQHCREIFMFKSQPKALLKSQQENVKLPQPAWAWNQKPRISTALRDNVEVRTWHF